MKMISAKNIIRYLIVFKGYHPLLDRNLVESISILKQLPISPLQFSGTVHFFAKIKQTAGRLFTSINFILDRSLNEVESYLEGDETTVIICESAHFPIVGHLAKERVYIYLTDKSGNNQNNNVISNVDDLIQILKKQTMDIYGLDIHDQDIPNSQTCFSNRNPIINCYCIKNQISGYIWSKNIQHENLDPTQIMSKLLVETKIISEYHRLVYPIQEYELIPLVIAVPTTNHIIKDILEGKKDEGGKDVLKILAIGQDENYLLQTIPNKHTDRALILLKLLSEAVDAVGYLQAILCMSPFWRLPLLSDKYDEYLTRFSPPDPSGIPRGQSLLRQIEEFGTLCSEILLKEEHVKYLSNHNHQLVFLSDYPVEWLFCNEMPICFSHDVCRIPLNNLNGVVAHFMKNQHFSFEIEENILSETIVAMCSYGDPTFEKTYEAQKSVLEEIGFKNSFRCDSINSLVELIRDKKPKILILDTHGGYDLTSSTSFLKIGSERLTPEDVVHHKLSVPIVVFSACCTYPLRKVNSQISEAFFGVGSLSVTTTYIPLDMRLGSSFVIRLINNLTSAAAKPIHENWLGFMSHLCRTSFFSAKILREGMKFDKIKKKEKYGSRRNSRKELYDASDLELIIEEQAKVMIYSNRKELYKKWRSELTSDILPEFLSYSNIGRPDLIKFKIARNEIKQILNKIDSHNDGMAK